MEDSYLDQYWEDVNEVCGPDYECYDEEDYDDDECYDSMDGDFDSAMRDAGHGTDEDYGYYGEYDDAA